MAIYPADVREAVSHLTHPLAIIVVIGGPTDYEYVSERHPRDVVAALRFIADQIENRPAVL